MTAAAHLWAIGYDDMGRADQVREEVMRLGWDSGKAGKYLVLLDVAVVVRHPDGSFTFDRKPFPGVANILGCTAVGFLGGLVLAAVGEVLQRPHHRRVGGQRLERGAVPGLLTENLV
jgi:hypothetical protein